MDEKKRYNAICLNLDTTQEKLDKGTLMALAEILKRRVQVLLNAGDIDKESALNYVRTELIRVLEKKYNVPFEELKAISVMCDDGKTILCTTGMEKKLFDDEEKFETKDFNKNAIHYLEMPETDIMGLGNAQLEDVNVTKWIDISKLYPTICDQQPNQGRTTKKLAVITHKLEGIRANELKSTNGILNDNFGVNRRTLGYI